VKVHYFITIFVSRNITR